MALDLELATATGFMEVSGEPEEGQRAFAYVIVNRLKSGKFGPTLASVVLQPYAFSCWNTKDPNRMRLAKEPESNPVFERIRGFILDALSGADSDPTGGACFYFNPKLAMPDWAKDMIKTAEIGSHVFYK